MVPTFSTLPTPFFTELSSTLAARNHRRTLASLNATCKYIRARTLAGLWRACHFGKRYQWLWLVVDDELRVLIKEIWIEIEVLPSLQSVFPNLTTIIRTWSPRGEANLTMDIDIISCPPTHHPLLFSSIIDATHTVQNLKFIIASDAVAGFTSAIRSLSRNRAPRFQWSRSVKVRVDSDEDAIQVVGALTRVMSDFQVVHVRKKVCPDYLEWFDLESQIRTMSKTRRLDNLRYFFYSVEAKTTTSSYNSPSLSPDAKSISPDHTVLRKLATDLGNIVPSLETFGHHFRLRFEDQDPRSDRRYKDEAWITKVERDREGYVANAVVSRSTLGPGGVPL